MYFKRVTLFGVHTMPIDIAHEEIITPAQAARYFPQRPHRSAIYRWMRDCRPHRRLESILIGGRRFTSLEAIARWVAELNGERPDPVATRGKRIEQAERACDKAGV